jgi:S-DNA-T family DNA segregation ATPase FtsK/SpoIIIE
MDNLFKGNSTPSTAKKTDQSPRGDKIGIMVEEMLQECIVVSSMGAWWFLKSFVTARAIFTIPLLAGIAYLSYLAASKGLHLLYLHDMEPKYIFTAKRVNWLWNYPLSYHLGFLFSVFIFPVLLMAGIMVRSIRTKFIKLFKTVGITNGLGDTPKLIKEKRIDSNRKTYIFDANGVGISEFEAKKERIESLFKTRVESIKHGSDRSKIAVTFTTLDFPDRLAYTQLLVQKTLPKESFYIGQGVEGILTQGIAELPHMLIAGTTGSGKSIFFKQCLLGLLESSPYLQMYLIDLKGGLEMIDFKKAPNVKVIKDLDQAVAMLAMVEKEMKDRFSYLEESQRKQIVPERDKKDRIIVAVDEASVLYMNRNKFDPDYENALKARMLADSISKLSRAAAIHLLLATQKLDRQVIPTSVSENISGRMAFRANSLQGSLIVLGTKDACDLPEIPGRGIWSFGTKKVIVQAPFVDEKTIKQRCEQIHEMFQRGKRFMLSPMIGEPEKKVTFVAGEEAYSDVGREK